MEFLSVARRDSFTITTLRHYSYCNTESNEPISVLTKKVYTLTRPVGLEMGSHN